MGTTLHWDGGSAPLAGTYRELAAQAGIAVGIAVDEINYGVSPGDGFHATPYAHVGPWTPREGPFWNAPFGAVRPIEDVADAAAVAEFFEAGRREARA